MDLPHLSRTKLHHHDPGPIAPSKRQLQSWRPARQPSANRASDATTPGGKKHGRKSSGHRKFPRVTKAKCPVVPTAAAIQPRGNGFRRPVAEQKTVREKKRRGQAAEMIPRWLLDFKAHHLVLQQGAEMRETASQNQKIAYAVFRHPFRSSRNLCHPGPYARAPGKRPVRKQRVCSGVPRD